MKKYLLSLLLVVFIIQNPTKTSAAENSMPYGSISKISTTGYIIGGAFDKDNPKPIIHFYLDSPSGTTNYLGLAKTYGSITDANSITGGYFKYQVPIEKIEDGRPHKVYAYVIDVTPSGVPGTNKLVGGKPYDIPIVPIPTAPPFAINNLMVAIPTLNSVTILVNTSLNSNVTIDYGSTTSYGKSVTSDNKLIHKILIPSLAASTTYHYRVTAKQSNNQNIVLSKPDSTFKTQAPPGQHFTFAAISDMQGQEWSAVVNSIKALNPDLLLSVGDSSDNYMLNYVNRLDYYLARWQKDVFDYSQSLTKSIASYFIMGNHDFVQDTNIDETSYAKNASHSLYSQILAYPQSSEHPETNYSFDYGDAHIATLNTFDGCASNSQIDWIDQDLATSNQKWKIVVMHIPNNNPGMMSTPSSRGFNCLSNNSEKANKLHQIFKNRGVRLVINGHSHTYSRWVKDGIYFVTNSTAGNFSEFNSPTSIMNIFDLPDGEAGTTNPPKSIAGSGYLTGSVSSTEINIKVYHAPEISTSTGGILTSYVLPHYGIIDTFTLKNTNSLPGDFNSDSKVNAADYTLFVAGFGTKYTILDYAKLVSGYGK